MKFFVLLLFSGLSLSAPIKPSPSAKVELALSLEGWSPESLIFYENNSMGYKFNDKIVAIKTFSPQKYNQLKTDFSQTVMAFRRPLALCVQVVHIENRLDSQKRPETSKVCASGAGPLQEKFFSLWKTTRELIGGSN
ncbi:MAG: hypothetical protein K2Q26_13615 [Bdellovibrionales bacterium]|nr:hypothetical protein [Bdellovibrionales bacterium]